MKILKCICVGLVVAAVSHAAGAHDVELSKQYDTCMDKSEGEASLVKCIVAENKRQDLRLSRAYKALMNSLAPSTRKELLDVQKIWTKYRDANCAFYVDPDEGRQGRLDAYNCTLTTTANRARELEDFRP